MATMALVQTQVEDTVRTEVEEVLKREGLTLAEAFRFFLERTAQEKAIPSEVFRPNAETIEALEESRRGNLPQFNSVEALMADLLAED